MGDTKYYVLRISIPEGPALVRDIKSSRNFADKLLMKCVLLVLAAAVAVDGSRVAPQPRHSAFHASRPAVMHARVSSSRPIVMAAKEKEAAAAPPPEVTFFEGPPSWTEAVVPGISIITVLGIVPFAAAISRQVWTRYKITNRRISVQSGWGGNDLVEVVYRDITEVKFIYRFGGLAGDMVMELSDGAKLEIRSMPEFEKNYDYIMQQVSDDCRARSNYKPLTKVA